jgi:hypothetical protein
VRAFREMIGSTSGGSEGGVMSVGSGDSAKGGPRHRLLKHPRRWP